MEKENNRSDDLKSLTDIHRLFGLPNPLHPLISIINNSDNAIDLSRLPKPHILNFYKISYKSNFKSKLRYGQGYFDFDEGGLMFASPGQVLSLEGDPQDHAGYTILIHPDFFLGNGMSKKIKQYGFFSYSVDEALYLSDKERSILVSIFKIIEEELNSRIDDYTQNVVISQVELLLNYSERFYKRQFITRRALNNDLLQKLENILDEYFSDEDILQGAPSVQYFADKLNLSASYLSDMLRSLTGHSALHFIHDKLIEKAKVILSTTNFSVAEIAYQLGFEHPQSFSRLFKAKTNYSPVEFKKSFYKNN